MRLRPFFLAAALAALSAAAACTLNPQPLPPEDGNAAADKGQDGGRDFGTADAGATNQPEIPPPAPADASQTDGDGAAAVGEGGSDAGSDGGDAATDGGDAGDGDAG